MGPSSLLCRSLRSAYLVLLLAGAAFPQNAPVPQPVPGAPNVLKMEGTDTLTGIHYVRLILSLPAGTGDSKAPPRFTLECTEDAGRRDVSWLVSFGGVTETAFTPPFRPTPQMRHPRPMPSVDLTMDFEGYTRWKPVTRAWSMLPSGELRYRNPGMHSPNLESLHYFLPYLNALPGLRIGYAHPGPDGPREVLFETRPLLDEMAKTPLCQ